jgi:sugar lactone lactonase YvrE
MPGHRNGIGLIARFNLPHAIAIDRSGDLYVADTGNHTIRKITFLHQVASVETFAGRTGHGDFRDDVGGAARFNAPSGIAVDTAGNVYVADTGNDAIRKISRDSTVRTIARDLRGPMGVAVDSAGNVYVADTINHTIRKVDGMNT